MSSGKELSRKEFIKLSAFAFPAGYCALRPDVFKKMNCETSERDGEVESIVPADRVPIIEYRYPGYKDPYYELSKEMFEAQMDFLKETKRKTLTDTELNNFLKNDGHTPSNAVALRMDQGAKNFKEFKGMVDTLRSKDLHAIVFLVSGDDFSEENWDDLAGWHREGLLSIGSGSLTNKDSGSISKEDRVKEASRSKEIIEEKFKARGEKVNVIGYSFPFNSVPEDVGYLKDLGYKFCVEGSSGRNIASNNAREGDFLLPSFQTLATGGMMEIIKANANNNPRSINLSSGYTFDKLMYFSSTPVTPEKIEKATGQSYQMINISDQSSPLPVPKEYKNLVRPTGIILHTDDQPLNNPGNWVTEKTYYGLQSRNTNIHFAVGVDESRQFLPTYPDHVNPTHGAYGYSNYLQIEMCGRDYSTIVNGECESLEANTAVDFITEKTLDLVTVLMKQYDIPKENILGHYEVTASGKSDPGEDYMKYFFDKLNQRTQIKGEKRF